MLNYPVQITDEIADIVYRNEENGYSVLRLKNSGQTATGVFAYVAVGQEFSMRGEYTNNAKFGKQFRVTGYEILPPNTPNKIRQFIGSGLLEGVGPKTAELIVAEFGRDTLKILEEEPGRLAMVRGISMQKADKIGKRYAEIKQMQAVVIFLQRFDISLNMALKIYKHYGDNTIERVQTNPYVLIETIDGIGFITADKMAKDLGIDYDGPFRVRAGVLYTLKQSGEQDGNTYLPKEKLFLGVCRLLKIKTENLTPVFQDVLYDLCMDRFLTSVSDGYMLTRFYAAEKSIATRMNILARENGNVSIETGKILAHYEEMNRIQLHQTQIEAIKLATTYGVCVITGGPGTGKTTIIKAILYINDAEGKTTQLLAPTGRAAKRLEETTGRGASTIHRALDIEYGGKMSGGFDDEKKITADIVIVDEVSMCDVLLVNQFLKRVPNGTRVIFVGDVDQLPSVGAGNVLSDIIESGVIPVVRLTEIYRQQEASKIVTNAHAINNGQMPDLSNKSTDFFYEYASDPSQIREKVIALVSERLPKYFRKLGMEGSEGAEVFGSSAELAQLDGNPSGACSNSPRLRLRASVPSEPLMPLIQVLCPMKLGEAGMNSLNLGLQEALNPGDLKKASLEFGQTTFRTGDRVMQIVNNYNQEWTRDGELGSGLYNGDIGVITAINRQNGEVTVRLEDGRVAIYVRTDLNNLVLSYAITVHKSQGCEFDVVIIPVTSGAYMILTRNLLYTAVTRAKTMVILVGDSANIEKMVNNIYTQKRHTMLEQFLIEMKNRAEDMFGEAGPDQDQPADE